MLILNGPKSPAKPSKAFVPAKAKNGLSKVVQFS
jgi:hypothetical protein